MSKTNNETMQKLSFENLLEKYHFIVPEIQREYVWGANINILNHFFYSIKSEEKDYNIGFLYSYTPKDASDNTVYLIDGQQRFTTLYLASFFYALKEKKIECFKKMSNYFTYKVRTTTKEFLEKLVKEVPTIEAMKTIEDQTWYLSHYKHDPSIKNMLELLKWLHTWSNNNESMYDKLMAVTFWNFNINETGQGEELYITMNSRGEKIVDNEVIRAHIVEKTTDRSMKITIGKEYDRWQDFFWKHRGDNPNADNGFNEFLKWIVIIENEKDDSENKKIKYAELNNIQPVGFCDLLQHETIKKYFTTLKKLTEYFTNDSNDLKYLPKLNEKNSFSDCLSGNMNNHPYMFLLPVLSLYAENSDMEINDVQFKRWMRFFYNIAFNKESFAIQSILQLVKYIKEKHIKDVIELKESKHDIINSEEKSKLEELSKTDDRSCLEQLFWDLEDHPILQGEVKPFIDHIEKESESFNNNELEVYKDIFFKCFIGNYYGNDLNLLRRALLTFSEKDKNGKYTPDTAYTIDCEQFTYGEIWQPRYSFCNRINDWKKSFKGRMSIYFELFSKLKEKPLQEIVSSFKDTNNYFDIIINDEDETLLNYSGDKYFTFDRGEGKIGYILNKTRSNGGYRKV